MEAVTLILLGLLFWPSHQRPVAAAHAGERVRIAASPGRWTTGVVRTAGADSLIFATTAGEAVLHLHDGTAPRIQVSRGRATRARRGMRIGLVTGAAVGIGAGLLFEAEVCDYSCPFGGRGDGAAILGATAALAGIGIGAIIGAASHHERWAELVPAQPSVTLTAPGGGVGLGLRWSLPPIGR